MGLPAEAPIAVGRGVPLGLDLQLFAISPAGGRLVYVGDLGTTTRLYLAQIGQFGAVPLEGTDGAYSPFFSPDGEWVGFAAGGQIKRVSLIGGGTETVCDLDGGIWGMVWDRDTIYFTTDTASVIK